MAKTNAAQLFRKALLQLDFGKPDRGEETLRQAIELAEIEHDELTYYGASVALGELLLEQGEDGAAEKILRPISTIVRDDDLLDVEVKTARELLEDISGDMSD